MKELKNILELFFVIAASMAMPFIVIGSYFSLTPEENRHKTLAIFFFAISFLYALTYTYFSWQSVQKSPSWRKVKGEKNR